MPIHEIYMRRCLELALNGLGFTAPNPMVGSVVVHGQTIIGEGYHRQYGGPHAEVNAIANVQNTTLLHESTLYVNLEPCAHFGKTPPCSDLIIRSGIPTVVIGCRDPFAQVNGKGIEKLRQAGVEVTEGVLENEALALNRRFFTFHQKKRPYIILKWAQSADGCVARADYSSKWISSPYSRLMVHLWRSQEAAIAVGTTTARYDDPQLTARDMHSSNPVRIVIDRKGVLPTSLRLFDGSVLTFVFTEVPQPDRPNIRYILTDFNARPLAESICELLYQENIQSVIIEGGSHLLNHFIVSGLWDEARVFTGPVFFGGGIAAPHLPLSPAEKYELDKDRLEIFYKAQEAELA